MVSSFFSGISSLFSSKPATSGANETRKANRQMNTSSGANGVGAGKANRQMNTSLGANGVGAGKVGKATGQMNTSLGANGVGSGKVNEVGKAFGGYKRRTKNKKRKNRTRK